MGLDNDQLEAIIIFGAEIMRQNHLGLASIPVGLQSLPISLFIAALLGPLIRLFSGYE